MRNYRFKLSDMMPNAWFYKLKDNMNRPRNQSSSNPTNKKLHLPPHNPRKSLSHTTESEKFYTSPKNMKAFDTQFPHEPPRRSSKTRIRRKTVYKPSPTKIVPSVCICREPEYPVWLKPGKVPVHDNIGSSLDFLTSPDRDFLESHSSEFEYSDSLDFHNEALDEGVDSWPRSSSWKVSPDIIIDMEKLSCDKKMVNMSAEIELISELGLRPILTKPAQHKESITFENLQTEFQKENRTQRKKKTRTSSSSPGSRKSVSRSGGVKIRSKLGSKRNETRGRKSVKGEKKGMFYSQSLAIVKASLDPEQDFKESMMEMIVENNIRAAKELEDLLASYLSLNSNQYHDVIIKAFQQIWFSMPQH